MKVLVVEDELLISKMLKTIIEKSGHEVIQATSGFDAVYILENNNIQLIFSDINMDDGDGFHILKFLEKKSLQIPIIMISAYSDEQHIKDVYNYKVFDYITKPFFETVILAKLKKVEEIYYPQSSHIIFDQKSYTVKIKQEKLTLSAKEFEVFHFLYQNKNNKFTKYDLINELWYGNTNMSGKIVEVTISKLRKKLKNYGSLVKSYRNQGYCYENEK